LNARAQIALLTCYVSLTLAGCNRVEPIEHYRVVKEDALGRLMGDSAREVKSAEPTDRIVAAVIPRGEQAWVFRLTGPVEPVGTQLEPFKQLVQSTRFESDGKPKWTLPAGWTDELQQGLRYSTITIPTAGGAPLDLSVSVLPMNTDAGYDAYLLSNVNRWRGQLQLGLLPPLRLHESVEELKADTLTASLVDISGRRTPTDGMPGGPVGAGRRPPGMPAPNSPTSHAPGPDAPAANAPSPSGPAPTGPMPTGPKPSGPAPSGPSPGPTSGAPTTPKTP
jgi:hypothetical protein